MIGILFTARLGSSRLRSKQLIEAHGKPLIYWMISRFENEFAKEIKEGKVKLIIATSEKPENKAFLKVTENTNWNVYFGSDNNIPLRHLQCAEKYNLDHVISVDGDDILCSSHAARVVYNNMLTLKNVDIFSVSGLPIGMNLSGYSVSYLKKSIEASDAKKLETGWGRIFIDPVKHDEALGNYDIYGDLRFTLDYEEDATFFTTVIEKLGERTITIKDDDLIKFVEENKFYEINAGLKEKYWENYNSEKQKEIDNDR